VRRVYGRECCAAVDRDSHSKVIDIRSAFLSELVWGKGKLRNFGGGWMLHSAFV
jgi:hypothetical protein